MYELLDKLSIHIVSYMYRILIISILQLNKNEMHLKYVYSFNLGEKQAGGMTYLGFPTRMRPDEPTLKLIFSVLCFWHPFYKKRNCEATNRDNHLK